MPRHTGLADVNGTRLYYEVTGRGTPLVLIHGHALDTRMWDDQFALFGQRHRVVRYDMRGYGRSAPATGEPHAPADDLMSLLEYLDISHAHVLGLSRGGGVAIDFALTYPQATDSLILADAALGGFPWPEFAGSVTEVKRAWQTGGDEAAARRWLGDALFAPALENAAVAAHLRQIVGAYTGWRHWVEGDGMRALDPPAAEQLDQIKARTLVTVGQRDVPGFRAIAEILVRDIVGARSVVLPGVGHMANMEAPDRFNEAVLSFLAESVRRQQASLEVSE